MTKPYVPPEGSAPTQEVPRLADVRAVHIVGIGGAGMRNIAKLFAARGIAVKPEILLLDEPTSALDPISTLRIEELIHDLKQEFTLVIVTHNMQQAARVSDYTAYMYLGELIEFGETDALFIKPKSKQTEDYITGRFG